MFRRFLSLTLIVALFQCPLICGLAPAVCAEEQEVTHPCACCHHRNESVPAQQAPTPTDSGNALCQCICNGAVVEHAIICDLGIDLSCWLPVTDIAPAVAPSDAQLSIFQAASQPDDGTNPGRTMRCLYMTYLC
jgi:hypothetical protein